MAKKKCEECETVFQDHGANMALCGSCLTKEHKRQNIQWINTPEESRRIVENFRRNPPSTIKEQIENKIGASLDTREGRQLYADFWQRAEKRNRR